MTKNIGIYLYDQVEVLDFAGPFEVFSTASRVYLRSHPDQEKPFEVLTVSHEKNPISARAGLQVGTDYLIGKHPPLDLLLIPGGVVTDELKQLEVIEWIRRTSANAELTASVCTGAFLLAKAGLLEGKRVTTHWEDIPDLRAMFPQLEVFENIRWVDDGKITTSAGISAGIDMSLHLVAQLEGEELAVRTARQMDYRWQREG